MHNSCLTFAACGEELFQATKVDVSVEDLVLGFANKNRAVRGSMPVEKGIGLLLELLGTDFLCSDALGNDEATSGDFPEALCKNLRADDVPLNDFHVVARGKCFVHRSWIDILGGLQKQSVFIEGHFDDGDACTLRQTGHKIAECGVEPTAPAGGDKVSRMGTSNDLLN